MTHLLCQAILLFYFIKTTLACYGATLLKSGGLSCFDKKLIVEEHNKFRQRVAIGQLNGQPPAASMLEMSWDEELARKAQSWADNCIFQHDSNRARKVSRFSVGQNIAITTSYPIPDPLGPYPDFISQIKSWFSEVFKFGYAGIFTHDTGHYSQIIWGDTYLVGCGYSYYYQGNRYKKLYVCNYGPAGNVEGVAPYKRGVPSCSLYGTSPSRNFYGLCEVNSYFKPRMECHIG